MVSFFGIVAYLSIRFKTDYAIFAIVALFHDVLITAGLFAVLGLAIGLEVDSLFLVALLTHHCWLFMLFERYIFH